MCVPSPSNVSAANAPYTGSSAANIHLLMTQIPNCALIHPLLLPPVNSCLPLLVINGVCKASMNAALWNKVLLKCEEYSAEVCLTAAPFISILNIDTYIRGLLPSLPLPLSSASHLALRLHFLNPNEVLNLNFHAWDYRHTPLIPCDICYQFSKCKCTYKHDPPPPPKKAYFWHLIMKNIALESQTTRRLSALLDYSPTVLSEMHAQLNYVVVVCVLSFLMGIRAALLLVKNQQLIRKEDIRRQAFACRQTCSLPVHWNMHF